MDPYLYPYGAPYPYSHPPYGSYPYSHPPPPPPLQPNYLSPHHQYPPPQSHPNHYQNPNPNPHQNPPPLYYNHAHFQNPNPNPYQNPPPLYAIHTHSSSHHGDSNVRIEPVGGSQHGGGWGSSLRVLLLHGSLDIWVCDARNLPNKDRFSKTIRNMVGNLSSMTSDPYVSIRVCGAVVGRTYVVSNEENPVWMQHFNIPVAHKAAVVEFLIKDNDVVGSDFIGNVRIPSEQICSGQRVEGTYPVLDGNGNHCNPGATLRISIQYVPIERYQSGIGVGPMYTGVLGTYFPLRVGGRVTLYQDAHVPDGYLPDLRLEGDRHYVHGQCWVDMFEAMSKAKHLIYIAGWSVLHTVQLVRDGGRGKDQSLGDLLKFKAQEGIRVLLLVWDDPTSRSILRYKTVRLLS